MYEEKTTIKRYFLQSVKNDVLEKKFVILQGTKIHHTQLIYESFPVKYFFVAALTTSSAVLKFRGMQCRLLGSKWHQCFLFDPTFCSGGALLRFVYHQIAQVEMMVL